MPIKHAKQSGLPADEGDPTQVEPTDWYADHTGDHDPVTVGTGLDVTGQLVELDLSEVAAGGELAGFLDAPTVDATHSGSTHAATQAAAEATASGALGTHAGAADPHTGYRLESADHSHASTGAQGGTIAHSATTGQTANDHHAQLHAASHQDGGADEIDVTGLAGGGSDPQAWQPAHYVGTWAIGDTYGWGDAVRADDSGNWKLYISLVDANLGNDPVGDAVNWQDVVADARPVVVEGTANPNTVGEQNRITHYTHDATGGTFDLGTATGIDWDALQADIQTALDSAYAAGKTVVTGDAADFTVEFFFDDESSLDFDDANLTGGGLTLQDDTQDQVRGSFRAVSGTVYIEKGDFGRPYVFSSDANNWFFFGADTAEMTSAADRHLISSRLLRRFGSGNGNANASFEADRGGSGAGDANIASTATITGTAVGTAVATMLAIHHTGGDARAGSVADASGAYVQLGDPDVMGNSGKGHKVGDLVLDTTTDETSVVAQFNLLRTALIELGLAVDGD